MAVVQERELLAAAEEANTVEVAHGVEPEVHAALEEEPAVGETITAEDTL